MGTRAETVFRYADNLFSPTLYRNMDGYPAEHGKAIAEALKEMVLTDALYHKERINTPECRQLNGGARLMALLAARIYDDANIYLVNNQEPDFIDDFIYIISKGKDISPDEQVECHEIRIEVYLWRDKIFDGNVTKFAEAIGNGSLE